MNRTTSLFLALGILVAHVLAIHNDAVGRFAVAFDDSHVAFRMARNLVRNGFVSWNGVETSFDAYPSPLWILVCFVPERLWYPDPSSFCQGVGIACTLATCLVLSRFSRERLSGVIAPLLFAFSGGVASMAASGSEIPMLGLWVAASFLSFERRRPLPLALFLLLAVLTRFEGVAFAFLLFAMELGFLGRYREDAARVSLAPYVPAAVAVLAIAALRASTSGAWVSPSAAGTFTFDAERLSLGLAYTSDFFAKSGSAWLVVFPLVALFLGRLGGAAARSLYVALFWVALVAWQGGSSLPFWGSLTPALPLLFLAVQEGITRTIDTRRRIAGLVAWTAFVASLALSGVASKKPGSIGPLNVSDLHFAWMEPSPSVRRAYGATLGREGLRATLRRTELVRAIGRFMRAEFEPEHTVATPWPGAIGYQSRREIRDILGRTTPLPRRDRQEPWFGAGKADLVALLEKGPDHVVLTFEWSRDIQEARAMLQDWLARWDVVGYTPERWLEFMRAVQGYELVTIPILDRGDVRVTGSPSPFTLLRRRALGLEPRLEVELADEGEFAVLVEHDGYDQLIDLEIRLVDRQGMEWFMQPDGRFEPRTPTLARSMLLVNRTFARPIELARGTIPRAAAEIVVKMINPGMPPGTEVAMIGEEVRVELDQ
jgi:hypothetical protein